MFQPEYKSKGVIDILNRGKIIRLLKSIDSLKNISSSDLESVEFIELPGQSGVEATKTVWVTAELPERLLREQAKFNSWGIKLRPFLKPRYPDPLTLDSQQKKENGQTNLNSLLRGARSNTPENLVNPEQSSKRPPAKKSPTPQDWSWLSRTINTKIKNQ